MEPAEQRYCSAILAKTEQLRAHLAAERLCEPYEPKRWFNHLTGIKTALGNLNNDISFVATLLAKQYLEKRFEIVGFDAGAKAQGAPGIDIELTSAGGELIVGEIKTTRPYQPGFGAKQLQEIRKDFARLSEYQAHHRFFFVTDPSTFSDVCAPRFAAYGPAIEIVNLLTEQSFRHE